MLKAFFQHIPRGLFEPIAIIGLTGCLLWLCKHWKKDRRETLFVCFALFFSICWRTVMPVNSDRYVIILIPWALFFTVLFGEDLANIFRRFRPLPWMHILLGILLAVCLVRSLCFISDDRIMFTMINVLKADARTSANPVKVFANRDISCFLGKDFEVVCPYLDKPLQLRDFPDGDYYLFKLNARRMPEDTSGFILLKRIAGRRGSVFMLWKRMKTP